MATLYMDPDRLEEAILCLEDLAAEGESIRLSIDIEFTHEGDPIDPTTDLNNLSAAHTAVMNRATEIRACRQTIIDLNENGIASMNADGTITCTVPDTVDINSASDLTSWAQAETDAHDLDVLLDGGEPATDRTYDEVVASMSTNKDNATYAAAFIDATGPENLTSLPGLAREHNKKTLSYGDTYDPHNSAETLAGLLGELLAQASSTWDDTESQAASDAIVSSVDDPAEYTRIPALNAMMGGHDANGDHVNDLKFGSDFLCAMATGLEGIDLEAIERHRTTSSSYNPTRGDVAQNSSDAGFSDPCYDPLAGVLDAMGNNPEAAIEFLAPPTSDDDDPTDPQLDTTRMEELAARDWDPTGFAGLTAAAAAASSVHMTTTDPNAAKLSWEFAGTAIHQIALHGEESLYNDDAKGRVGILLTNCAGAVTSLWNRQNATDHLTTNVLPNVSRADVNALTYHVADNPEAVATISASLAEHASELSDSTVIYWQERDNTDEQIQGITSAYSAATTAVASLANIADGKANDLSKKNEKASQDAASAANTATAIIAAVVTAPMGPWASAATTVGATVFSNAILDEVINSAPASESSARRNESDIAFFAAAVQDAADAGLISQEAFSHNTDHTNWILQNEDGTYYVDTSKLAQSDLDKVAAWTEQADRKTTDPNLTQLNEFQEGLFGDGYAMASNSDPGTTEEEEK